MCPSGSGGVCHPALLVVVACWLTGVKRRCVGFTRLPCNSRNPALESIGCVGSVSASAIRLRSLRGEKSGHVIASWHLALELSGQSTTPSPFAAVHACICIQRHPGTWQVTRFAVSTVGLSGCSQWPAVDPPNLHFDCGATLPQQKYSPV